jgi:L-2-hydroxycarboxylate dehydrogenase (NAD+)
VSAPPRFSVERLEAFAQAVFEAVGATPEHSVITARRLLEADLRGRTGHGLIRIPLYVDRIQAGSVNLRPDIRVLNESPTSALVDGDNGLGQVVMTRAAELAIAKAEGAGMAWVGTVNSNHAGAAGIYPAMAVARGLISIYLAVGNANSMPPWGGNHKVLSTNPIAIAVPAGDDPPFQLDIATTVASHGTIKVAAQAGEEMPVGWVIDDDGEPITDPNRAHDGFLMPIGGYKGSGLNIAIGLLAGVLNGAAFGESVIDQNAQLDAPTNTGQAMFVMRSDLFRLDDAPARVADHLDELRHSGSKSGEPLRLPGDSAARNEAENLEAGIPVPDGLRQKLVGVAARLGIADRLETR